MNPSAPIRIDVWSDYVCPFCYLELPPIRRLQEQYQGQVEVVWRAFELRPDPKPTLDPDGEYLHTTWNRSVYPMAAERGMTLKLPPVQPRSRLAFEAVAHAREQGRFDPMHEALFRAFFEDGRDIGDVAVLADIGAESGVLLSTHIVSDVADLCANMAIINKGHVLLCGDPQDLTYEIEDFIWARFVSKQELPVFQKRHQVISTRLLTGRTLIHVYSETDPGDGFEPARASLEDVYFATIAGHYQAAAGNC